MTITRQDIIDKAREWRDTPWKHNGRKKGKEVDCVNFLSLLAKELGVPLAPLPQYYERIPHKNEIEVYLQANLRRVEGRRIEAGDVLLLSFRGVKGHIAIASTATSMIHASNYDKHMKVVEHNIDGVWKRAIDSIWELKIWD